LHIVQVEKKKNALTITYRLRFFLIYCLNELFLALAFLQNASKEINILLFIFIGEVRKYEPH